MKVKPKRVLTLIMAIALILPALSMPANAATRTTQRFTDVTPDEWYYEAVNALADAGIVNGYGSGEFKPTNPMTAGELATVLWNMMYGDWCKANELYNIFSNGYAEADYKNPNYPGPKIGNWGIIKDGLSPYRIDNHDVYPTTWDGCVSLAIYGDHRISPNTNTGCEGLMSPPLKSATTQITGPNGRPAGTLYGCYGNRERWKQADAYYNRDLSGLAIVAMSKEYITRGFAISELVNVLRETGYLERLYNASSAKDVYTNGASISDWANITDVYHDICAGSDKTADMPYHNVKNRYHDYDWAWNYIDEPGSIQIPGGYANTWFSRDILLAYQAGIVSGVDSSGRCNVGANMTRAEVCQMLYNAGAGKTKMTPLTKNGTNGNIVFIRDGKAYITRTATAYDNYAWIVALGPYDIKSSVIVDADVNNKPAVYRTRDGIDLRQQEWPTHPEFWGN